MRSLSRSRPLFQLIATRYSLVLRLKFVTGFPQVLSLGAASHRRGDTACSGRAVLVEKRAIAASLRRSASTSLLEQQPDPPAVVAVRPDVARRGGHHRSRHGSSSSSPSGGVSAAGVVGSRAECLDRDLCARRHRAAVAGAVERRLPERCSCRRSGSWSSPTSGRSRPRWRRRAPQRSHTAARAPSASELPVKLTARYIVIPSPSTPESLYRTRGERSASRGAVGAPCRPRSERRHRHRRPRRELVGGEHVRPGGQRRRVDDADVAVSRPS